MGSVFEAFPKVEWITGRPARFDASAKKMDVLPLPRWSRLRFLTGADKYIQQESTFWWRCLWAKAGGALNTAHRAKGDYDQWVRFFRHAPLYTVDALIGGYRGHEGALSFDDVARYHSVCDEIIERELCSLRWGKQLKLFRRLNRSMPKMPFLGALWRKVAASFFRQLRVRVGSGVIEHRPDGWVIRA